MVLLPELSVFEVNLRVGVKIFLISTFRLLRCFNFADAAKAKQARPILLKCQSFFSARRKNNKKKAKYFETYFSLLKSSTFCENVKP